jgi:hypothetical protein
MNRALTVCVTCLVALAEMAPTMATAADIDGLVNELTQSLTEDIHRQRLRARREDADETRRAQLPDLSQFGTPVTEAPRRKRDIAQWTAQRSTWATASALTTAISGDKS